MANTNDTIIQTIDLTKVYGMGEARVVALDEVSINIMSGEFVAILPSRIFARAPNRFVD